MAINYYVIWGKDLVKKIKKDKLATVAALILTWASSLPQAAKHSRGQSLPLVRRDQNIYPLPEIQCKEPDHTWVSDRQYHTSMTVASPTLPCQFPVPCPRLQRQPAW